MFGNGIDLPAIFRSDRNVIGECAGNSKAYLFKILAVIWKAIAAGRAISAPDHLFCSNHIADAKRFNFLADFDDLAGKFVTKDGGEFCKTRIQAIAIFVGLVEMDVRTAD